MKKKQLKELIKAHLTEMGVTGGTAASTPGTGFQTATPFFISKKKIKSVKDTAYDSLGFKDANPDKLAKKQKGIDYVHLWKSKLNEENFDINSYVDNLNTDDPDVKQRISKQMNEFEEIEIKLNVLIPLLQRAKQTAVNSYKKNPLIKLPSNTELAVDYLDDLIKLFKNI